MNLKQLGWNLFFETTWKDMGAESYVPARVILQQRGLWRVAGEFEECLAEPAGKLRLAAEAGADWPVVGDWVVVALTPQSDRGLMYGVLPRHSCFSRTAPGKHAVQQVIAANVDTAFLVAALDGDFNVRRMERYLAQCWESGARPVIVMNKVDACEDVQERMKEMERVSLGTPIVSISALTGENLQKLQEFLVPGHTHVLLGSSGTGKSTLANRLLGAEFQNVQSVREGDSRGRHTTTSRQLFLLPGDTLLMDTPGLRELQLWDAADGVAQTFADIDEIATRCRYDDCKHESEPGCAISEALQAGVLDEGRLENRRKLKREQEFQRWKIDPAARREEKERVVKLMRDVRKKYQGDKGQFQRG